MFNRALLVLAAAGFATAFSPAIMPSRLVPGAKLASSMPTRCARAGVSQIRATATFPMEVRAVEKEFRAAQGEEDVKHLRKMRNISAALYVLGFLSAGFCQLPWNPISAILISTAICVRWTMIGHHVSHGGYNTQVGPDSKFHRGKFGRGPVRRFFDWLDWMLPEAWDVEHNFMHHYELGEASDPDLVERNTHSIRVSKLPVWVKYLEMFALMTMWKWFYYSPNTLKEMYARQQKLAANRGEVTEQPFVLPKAPGDFGDATKQATIKYAIAEAFRFNFRPAAVLTKVMMPYAVAHFVVGPAFFYALFGYAAAVTAFVNLFVAEILTNIHSFVIVAPNHAGRDIYRFKTPVKVKSDEFYLRAVIGSTNFRTGGDFNDFLHGWLNYQIEHHMFPDMSMLSYQRMAPRIKTICDKYGVPYVQENVFKRVHKTLRISVGKDSMKVWENGD